LSGFLYECFEFETRPWVIDLQQMYGFKNNSSELTRFDRSSSRRIQMCKNPFLR